MSTIIKNIYYVSSTGEKVNLMEWPYKLQTGDFFDYEWDYEAVTNPAGGKIYGFKKAISKRSMTLSIGARDWASYADAINHLHRVTEADVLTLSPGRLYVEKSYLTGYVVSSNKTEWEPGYTALDNDLTFVTEYPFWCTESTYMLYVNRFPEDVEDYPFLDYPHDYPYDYYIYQANMPLVNSHYAPTDFEMTFYGPCSHPYIYVGGNMYLVNAVANDNERIVINSKSRTVVLVESKGARINLFSKRGKEHDIFKKIPKGDNQVQWGGLFDVVVTLFKERSEPEW